MDFFTFMHMCNADRSDSHKYSIYCGMLNEDERNAMSSTYKNMLVQTYSELHKRPNVLNFMAMSSIKIEKIQGNMTISV